MTATDQPRSAAARRRRPDVDEVVSPRGAGESTAATPAWEPSGIDPEAIEEALARLEECVAAIGPMVVAFSGGADSALVAHVAQQVLGDDALAVTAVSPSLAAAEHADCRALAAEWGLRWEVVHTAELDDPRYVANGGDRCYWCKDALLHAVAPLAEAAGATVALGVNLDDLDDHRPGQAAAASHGARFPLVEAGLTKAMVRAVSARLGLRTATKPAAACLASRVPYGTPVTIGILREVEAAEGALKALGFDELRVRHHRDLARIEVPLDRLADVVQRRTDVVDAVLAAGYRYVALDLEGFRSGSLNLALEGDSPSG